MDRIWTFLIWYAAEMAEEPTTTDGASTVATTEELQARSRDVVWYVKELSDIPEAAREVLENYSNIPTEQVHDHVYQVVRFFKPSHLSGSVSDKT